uniref:Uncharacterized protein n=1 Tax=Euglena hiemalis TaxID=392896 RepID=A0A345UC35_9EUGL|nr:hypothetical protein [Euglena hiemalis]AXI98021.1 hypothetical protein [Euglena hiemalis]
MIKEVLKTLKKVSKPLSLDINEMIEREKNLFPFPVIWRTTFNLGQLQILAYLAMRGAINPKTSIDKLKAFIKAELYRTLDSFDWPKKNHKSLGTVFEKFGEINIKWEDTYYQEVSSSKVFFKTNYSHYNLNFMENVTESQILDLIRISELKKRAYFMHLDINSKKTSKTTKNNKKESTRIYNLTTLDKKLIYSSYRVKNYSNFFNAINFPQNWDINLKFHQIEFIYYVIKDLIIYHEIHFKMTGEKVKMIVISELLSLINAYNRPKSIKPIKTYTPCGIPIYLDMNNPGWFKNEFESIEDYLYVLWPSNFQPMLNENKNFIVPFRTIILDDDSDDDDDEFDFIFTTEVIFLPLCDDGSYNFKWPNPILLKDNSLGLPLRRDNYWCVSEFPLTRFQVQLNPITIIKKNIVNFKFTKM